MLVVSRLLLLLLAFLSAVNGRAPITPSQTVSYGQWESFGVSLAWYANVLGTRSDLANVFFSVSNVTFPEFPDAPLPGLGFNSARYNVGACSFNKIGSQSMQASPNIPSWKQMESYWINGTEQGWAPDFEAVDVNQTTALLLAKRAGADVFELFSNSPPWWMLENLNPSGSNEGTSDNLTPSYIAAHALYLARVAAYFRDAHGLTFTSVEATNEPSASWWKSVGTQEGCHFDPSTTAQVLAQLRPALDAQGLQGVRLASADESLVTQALATWNAWDETTRGLVDQFNLHGYEYEGGDRGGLYERVVVQGGKLLRNSEWGDGDATGLRLANCWLLDFTFLHPRAMHYWQALDSYNWGLIEADVPGRMLTAVNPKFYVIAQFSRHIRPGMTLYDAGDASSATVVASDGKTLVIISLNNGTTPDAFLYDLSGWNVPVGAPIERWVTDCANTGSRYAYYNDMTVGANGKFFISLDASQLQTFQIQLK